MRFNHRGNSSCITTPLPLWSLLGDSPALAETVRFYREVLGVPAGESFKQYTRLTIVVESILLQAAAIKPAHPILRGYDLVAVHPIDQQAFGHASKNLEASHQFLKHLLYKHSFRLFKVNSSKTKLNSFFTK